MSGPQGKVEVNQLQVTLLDYPRLVVDDLLVETRQNRRYVVKVVTRTEIRGRRCTNRSSAASSRGTC